MSEPLYDHGYPEDDVTLLDDGTPCEVDQHLFRESLTREDLAGLLGKLAWFRRQQAAEAAKLQVIIQGLENLKRQSDQNLKGLEWHADAIMAQLEQHRDTIAGMIQEETRGRKKSVAHPSGLTIGFRSVKELLVIDDKDEVIAFAHVKAPTAGITQKVVQFKIVKNALDGWFAVNGEVPAGCHVEDAYEKLVVK